LKCCSPVSSFIFTLQEIASEQIPINASDLTYFFSLYFRSVNGRMRVGQEHKIVEIKGLEFYSRLFHGSMDLVTMNNKGDSYSASNIRLEEKHYYSILAPCDATLTLSVWTSLVEPAFSIIPS